jgi:WD40 repeat protein
MTTELGMQNSLQKTGRSITSGSKDNPVRLWDTATGRPIGAPMRIDDRDVDDVYPLSQSRLVSVDSDNTVIRLWDAPTGEPIGEPVRLPPALLDSRTIDWDDGGRRIAATVGFSTVQVWDAETMRETTEPLEHDGMVGTIGFSRDGTKILSASDDRTLRIWPVPSLSPSPEALCNKITHNMSEEQWARFVSPKIDYIDVRTCRKLTTPASPGTAAKTRDNWALALTAEWIPACVVGWPSDSV